MIIIDQRRAPHRVQIKLITAPSRAAIGNRLRSMQNFIEIQNIAKFKARLRIETEAGTRNVLMQLLAEEEAKHEARITAARTGPHVA